MTGSNWRASDSALEQCCHFSYSANFASSQFGFERSGSAATRVNQHFASVFDLGQSILVKSLADRDWRVVFGMWDSSSHAVVDDVMRGSTRNLQKIAWQETLYYCSFFQKV